MNNKNRTTRYRYFGGTDLDGKRLTWSGVVAGIFTFLAVFLTLSLIGFSIGLTTLNPLAENPLNHVGTNVTIWTIIALIISFASGGFISGLVANKAGFLHGFMTWVTGVILVAFLVTSTVGGLLKTTGSAVANVATGVGKGSTVIVSKSGDMLHEAVDKVSNEMLNVDTDELEGQVKSILKDTEVKELQPGYLNSQLDQSKEDIKATAKNIVLEPTNYKDEVNELLNKLENRTKTITDAVDKDTIANAVSNNTDLNDDEAKQAVDNIYNEYQVASKEVSKSIDEAKVQINQLSQDVEEFKEDVKVGADQAADTGAKSALYLFIGLLIAMIITSFAGVKGAEYLRD